MLSILFHNLQIFNAAKNTNFSEVASQDIAAFQEIESQMLFNSFVDLLDFSNTADFTAKGWHTQVKDSCKKGYPCGKACISTTKNCRNTLNGQSKTYASWLEQRTKKESKTAYTGKKEAQADETDMRDARIKELEAKVMELEKSLEESRQTRLKQDSNRDNEVSFNTARDIFKTIYNQIKRQQELRGVVAVKSDEVKQKYMEQTGENKETTDRYFDLLKNKDIYTVNEIGREIMHWAD